MAALPLVLAGPIVRRVDNHSAAVWIALSEPVDAVEIRLFEGLKKSTGPGTVEGGDAPFAAGSVQTRRMGEHLHLALAVADGSEEAVAGDPSKRFTLRPGGIFSYDLILHRAGQPEAGLKALGLLEDDPVDADPSHPASIVRRVAGVLPEVPRHLALGYETDRLPSFVLPAPILGDIRIAQTSRRKSHGPGSDALAWLDSYIGDRIDKADQRIQQLFLTGDQIYADDVPSCILPMYHDLALRLMGDGGPAGEEELPTGLQAAVRTSVVNMETAPPMRRTALVRSDGGFTSVESQNHLMTVGEYSAACLTAWSPHSWGALGDEEKVYGTALSKSAFTLTDLTKIFWREKEVPPGSVEAAKTRLNELHGPTFAAERQKVLVFASTVGKVARVLANTATYMIFDDHDVTDDWNLNRQWRNRVYSRPLGRSIVRNALIVYRAPRFFTVFGFSGPVWRTEARMKRLGGVLWIGFRGCSAGLLRVSAPQA